MFLDFYLLLRSPADRKADIAVTRQMLGRQEPRLSRPQVPRRLWSRLRCQRWRQLPEHPPRQAAPGYVRAHVERDQLLRQEPVARLWPGFRVQHEPRVSFSDLSSSGITRFGMWLTSQLVALPHTVTTSLAGKETASRRPWTRAATSTRTALRPVSLPRRPRSTTLAPSSNKPPRPSTAVSFILRLWHFSGDKSQALTHHETGLKAMPMGEMAVKA